jgi:hypothetical protein
MQRLRPNLVKTRLKIQPHPVRRIHKGSTYVRSSFGEPITPYEMIVDDARDRMAFAHFFQIWHDKMSLFAPTSPMPSR